MGTRSPLILVLLRRDPFSPNVEASKCGHLFRNSWMPAIVICGQIILQVLAWSFFAVVESRGFIALPYSTAAWAKTHAHPVTLVSTLISTVLAACSSFLFSLGVRRSIALHLHQPMSLAAFVTTVKISSRSLVLDPRKRKWSTISIVLVVLTGIQTSGWSTLLTPVAIVIETPLTGSELDLSSPLLHQMQSSGALDFCVFNSSDLTAFTVGQTESGYTAVKSNFGYPGSFTLMDQNFNISTAGVLPVTLSDVNASAWFPGMTSVAATIQGVDDLPDGLSSNYSMIQQGFTADVTCKFQNLTADTTPSLILQTDTVKDWNTLNASQVGIIAYSQISSDCIVPDKADFNLTSAITTGQQLNYVLMLACGPADNYTLIFESAGRYDWMHTTVCTLSPKILKVNVDYSDAIGTATNINGAVRDPDGPAGLSAVSTLSNMVFFAQAVAANIMGDELYSILIDLDPEDFADAMLLSMEEYIKGVTEYSGSVLRACLSGKNGTFSEGVPANMTIPTTGTYFTDTVGWTHVSATTIWVLIPGTLVAIVTIIVVLVAVAQHAGDPEGELFDPTNAMHLVAAAAAGGLNNTFTGIGEKDLQAGERVNIVLGSIPGRGPALVRTGDISPRFI
ncbi:hypothetical protein B0H10DRAFT_1327543 [Mycena sp. CBHHK59/15]|nr:hypothetical protein B0H10DRAFT_1327543 [Mycena sp. CBHHK59/15]